MNWQLVLAFAITPWLCRATLFANDLSTQSNQIVSGLVADVFWAALLALLVSSIKFGRRTFTALLFLLWNLAHLMDLENIIALGQLVHHSNLPYLLNAEFLGNTVNSLPVLKILLNAGFFALALLALFFALRAQASTQIKTKARPQRITLLALVISAPLLYQFLPDSQPRWQTRNFFALHLDGMAADLLNAQRSKPTLENIEAHPLFAEDLSAPRPEMGRAKNVLIIALEGITGAYLQSVTDYLEYPAPLIMPGLSALAKNGLVLPNFVVHRNQTNRGLYSILCSDYPKLVNDIAKPLEILSDNKAADRCLPRILAQRGYSTHYFQAANLQFMSKGTVMPFIGFEEVKGKESFPLPQDYYFDWGPDDKDFFEQSLSWLRDINKQEAPWFATLLTVGTHHPYAIKDHAVDREASQGSEKYAAVLAADIAVTKLIEGLQSSGLSENTLVLITSDESHGVPRHRFGNNWGLMVALAPDIKPGLNDEVFGSVDTTLSVLDYLNIQDKRPTMTGRSIFRHYEKERTMPLAQWSTLAMSDKKGEIILCPKQAQSFLQQLIGVAPCKHLLANNQQVFAKGYTESPTANHQKDNEVYRQQAILDARLQRKNDSKRSFVFNQNTEVLIHKDRSSDLLGGQFLTLPHHARIRLELDVSFQGDPAALLELSMSSTHLSEEQSGATFLAPLTLPTLTNGERLTLDLEFITLNAYSHGQTILRGITRLGSGKATIHSYTIHIESDIQAYSSELTLNSGLVHPPSKTQTKEKAAPLRLGTLDEGRHYNLVRSKALALGDSLSFADAVNLAQHGAVGFWPAEPWGSWSKQYASVNIATPAQIQSKAITLSIVAHAMLPAGGKEMPTRVFVNKREIAHWNISPHTQKYSALIPDNLLQGNNIEVSFELTQPLSSPQMLNAENPDKRGLGLAVQSLSLRP